MRQKSGTSAPLRGGLVSVASLWIMKCPASTVVEDQSQIANGGYSSNNRNARQCVRHRSGKPTACNAATS